MGQDGNGEAELAASKKQLFQHLSREIGDQRTIRAMAKVPREAFLPTSIRHVAYQNIALPIGYGQTISQPYIVAVMTAALDLQPTNSVLEVGAGSGYQAAILAELAARVTSVERLPALVRTAQTLLDRLGYRDRVMVRLAGEGLGCPEEAPFDAILVTAGAPRLPPSLLDQLAPQGRLVIPVGSWQEQDLFRVVRSGEGFSVHALGPCRFVPLIAQDAWDLLAQNPNDTELL